ncbi:MAG: minor capsid protein [Cyanobacteria bacterium J06638_20]
MADAQTLALVDRYDRALDGLEADVIERVNTALDASFRQIERELRVFYSEIADEGALYSFTLKTQKLNTIKSLLDQVVPDAQRAELEALYQEALQLASDAGVDLAGNLIGQIDPSYPAAAFSGVPIEAISAQARDGVDRLYRHGKDFARQASAVVELGLAGGHGTAKVAEQLRRQLGTTKAKAETIARTEVMSSYNTAAKGRYEEAGVDYVQWVLSPSEGNCSFCLARNMKVYKLGDAIIPAHPRCRCFLLPWLPEWQEKGLTDDAFAAQYRTEAIAQGREQGVALASGPSPLERAAGMERAPTPVWSPGDKPLAAQTKSSAAPELQASPPKRVKVPPVERARDLFERIGDGTQGTEIYRDRQGVIYKYGPDLRKDEADLQRIAGKAGVSPRVLGTLGDPDDSDNLRGFAMEELIGYSDGDRVLANLSEGQRRTVEANFVAQSRRMHELKISHYDQLWKNTLIDPETLDVKIIDFGTAAKEDWGDIATDWADMQGMLSGDLQSRWQAAQEEVEPESKRDVSKFYDLVQ